MIVQIKKILLCLPSELKEAIKAEATAKGMSQNSFILSILWSYFGQAK